MQVVAELPLLPLAAVEQLLFEPFAMSDVRADGNVLLRLSGVVEEGDNRRVHPVKCAIPGAVPNLAVPDASASGAASAASNFAAS